MSTDSEPRRCKRAGEQRGVLVVRSDRRAAAHERAGVQSFLFVVSYLGLGVPAVAVGLLAVHGAGLIGAARYYGAALILLAVLALPALIRSERKEGRNQP